MGIRNPGGLRRHAALCRNDRCAALIEKYPLEKAADAYARMMSGKAEFRVVLTMGN
jgi:D-arabinose 1-dehydrogenase-like Zn-dependent alcohol dehydrogenase